MTAKIPEMKLTNTLTGKKEVLQTLVPGKLTMYSCGPTVYGLIHVGNLRAAMTADLFYRGFKKFGYDVNYVRNYTDVDDKIIKRANEEGVTSEVISKRYIMEVERDYAAAAMLEPTKKVTITETMKEIISMIEKIIANGKAYVTADGEVLFSVKDFPGYGKLSKKVLEDLIAGARVEVAENKRNPADFSLWKPAKPGEPYWESPWSQGRPGWHIECSAMASKWLGDQIDVHHGGSDLTFPHHENEIAQSEAASGKDPYVRYWLHNAMLNINAEKMSKSLGNFVTARDFLTQFGGEITRMMMLSAHYRSITDFGEEAVDSAVTSLTRIYEAKKQAETLTKLKAAVPDQRAESAWSSFIMDCERAREEIRENMANDFNTPGAIGAVFTLIRAFNRTVAEPRAEATPSAVLGAQEFIRVIEDEFGGFLGLGQKSAASMLEKLSEIRQSRSGSAAGPKLDAAEIERLIAARTEAKKAKNFAEADRLRKELDEKGVVIKDTPQGVTWSYK